MTETNQPQHIHISAPTYWDACIRQEYTHRRHKLHDKSWLKVGQHWANKNNGINWVKHSFVHLLCDQIITLDLPHLPLHVNSHSCYFFCFHNVMGCHLPVALSHRWNVEFDTKRSEQILDIKSLVSHYRVALLQQLQQTTFFCQGTIWNRAFVDWRDKSRVAMRGNANQALDRVVAFVRRPCSRLTWKRRWCVDKKFCAINNHTSAWIVLFETFWHQLVYFTSRQPQWKLSKLKIHQVDPCDKRAGNCWGVNSKAMGQVNFLQAKA